MAATSLSRWFGSEPAIDEILSDPIVLLLMRSDGITSEEARLTLRGAALRVKAGEARCRDCP